MQIVEVKDSRLFDREAPFERAPMLVKDVRILREEREKAGKNFL